MSVDEVGGRGQPGGGFDVIEEAFDGGEGPLAGGAAGAVGGEDVAIVEALEAGEVAIAESRDEEEKSVARGEIAPLVTILVTVAALSVHHEYDGGGGCDVRRGVEIDGQRRAVPGGEREETIAGAKFFRGGGEGADGGEEREEKGAREGAGEGAREEQGAHAAEGGQEHRGSVGFRVAGASQGNGGVLGAAGAELANGRGPGLGCEDVTHDAKNTPEGFRSRSFWTEGTG